MMKPFLFGLCGHSTSKCKEHKLQTFSVHSLFWLAAYVNSPTFGILSSCNVHSSK